MRGVGMLVSQSWSGIWRKQVSKEQEASEQEVSEQELIGRLSRLLFSYHSEVSDYGGER
jgi:hypothetical protein